RDTAPPHRAPRSSDVAKPGEARGELPVRRIGRYTLVKRLGAGPIGEVFLATASSAEGVERKVALKRLHPRRAADRAFVAAAIEATRAAARLAHPNIATVVEVVDADPPAIVSEWVPGWDLGSILAEAKRQSVAVPVPIACRIVADVLAALDAAHTLADLEPGAGPVLHRDLAPEDVLVSRQGGVKVTDFGLATAGASAEVSAEAFVGKPEHAAPERFTREAGTIDVQADVFSAGTLLYELLVGRAMFARPTVFETMMAVLREPYPRMSALRRDVPGILDRLLEQAVARPRSERLVSAQAFQLELERFLARLPEPVTTAMVGRWARTLFTPPREHAATIPDGTLETPLGTDLVGDERTSEAPVPIPSGGRAP
ncbi:serine/threonine protein kinase, partial [Myxococcota bacterium]|nr:serine/threonine protein kinase [Myxococcota bacterium]